MGDKVRARAASGQRYGYGSEVVPGLNQKEKKKKKPLPPQKN